MDDRRVGRVLRALRRRKHVRQSDIAFAAGVSQSTVSRAERGHLGSLSLNALRKVFAAVDASFEGDVRWRGGALDRLLDERHAAVIAHLADLLRTWQWRVYPEVTFSRYGERGSIDILAAHTETRAVAVIEVKTEIASEEATLRTFDVKVRLAPAIARERLGWEPSILARVVALPDTTTNRRRLAGMREVLEASLPARGAVVREWFQQPDGPIAGIWLLRLSHARTSKCAAPAPQRVRATRTTSTRRRQSVEALREPLRERTTARL